LPLNIDKDKAENFPKQLYVSGGCGEEHKVTHGSLECEACEAALKQHGALPDGWTLGPGGES
jgi:hypothetical protein